MAVVRLAQCVYVVLLLGQRVRGDKTYIVDPSQSPTSCPGNKTECSLMYYAAHPDQYFREDNTTFRFLRGNHPLVTFVLVANISNLALCGVDDRSEVVVACAGNNSGGFSFYNITKLTITNLSLFNCSHSSYKYPDLIGLEVIRTRNLRLNNIDIRDTAGVGLSLTDLYGKNIINNTVVEFSHNTPKSRGGNFAYYCSRYYGYENSTVVHQVNISNSSFRYGYNSNNEISESSGILIEVFCSARIEITFEDVFVVGNHGENGGNIMVDLSGSSNTWTVSISFIRCWIANGTANSGGGLCMFAIAGSREGGKNTSSNVILKMEDTHFDNNTAYYDGGGMYLRLHQNSDVALGKIEFSNNCTFTRNKLVYPSKTSHGGVGVHIVTFTLPEYQQHKTIFFGVSFDNCTFRENSLHQSGQNGASLPRTGALYTENVRNISLENCRIVDNRCSGIVGINSNFVLSQKNEIRGNRAVKGGGIFFCAGSIMWLRNGSELRIVDNHAALHGGGIYVDGECSPAVEFCFFQVDNVTADNATLRHTQVYLTNNTASAGSAVYGGLIDHCVLYDVRNQNYRHWYPSKIFNDTFHIPVEEHDLSTISSDPIYVGFCEINSSTTQVALRDCPQDISIITIPGKTFSIHAVIMGQRYGLVSGVVVADCEMCTIRSRDYSQYINTSISTGGPKVTYTVCSEENSEVSLKLVAEDYYSGFPTYQYQPSYIQIRLEQCPLGFIEREQRCVCLLHIVCNITNQTVFRQSPRWIGYNNINNTKNIIVHYFCPLAYCREENVHINTTYNSFDQDAQCAKCRTGLLCGSCKRNYSLGFGSSQCLSGCNTHHRYLQYLRVCGLVAVCGVAGVLLVVLLTVLNLTVAEGTLNGLIFYANIVQVNVDLFFPSDTHARPWTAFIAWLNLDFGITVCFYDGMDAYVKTWLQFIFPLYIWILAGGIIYFSRISKKIAKLSGKNSVKVLATLFLLSFGKLSRTLIDVTFFTYVKSQDESFGIFVWLLDANVHYLHGAHIVLFVAGCIAALVVVLYALTLTFIQCLRRAPNSRMCGLVQRLKPLLDAYTGPYNDRYHFWTGFLLLVRIGLFMAFALNYDFGPTLNITLIITVSTLLITVTQSGIYQNRWIGLLESSIYINLIFFSAFTMLSMKSGVGVKTAVVCVFGGWALLTLVGIIIYHAYRNWCGSSVISQLFQWKLRRFCSDNTFVQPLVIGRDEMSDVSEESDKEAENSHEVDQQNWIAPNLRETLIGSLQNSS